MTIEETGKGVRINNMTLWFCHVKGGVHNYNFHGYLSEIAIECYRIQGCKVKYKYKVESDG